MAQVVYSGLRPGAFILSEAEGARSRDNLTIKAGNVTAPGLVLGKITTGGKLVPHDPGASDGSEVAHSISIYAYDATAADVMGAILTNDAEVIEDGLIFKSGISGPNKAAAIAALLAQGIKVRPKSYVG